MPKVLLVLLLAGCNLQRLTVKLTAPVIERGTRSMDREGDLEVAKSAAPSQLKTAEGMLETDPQNPILLRVLARGYLEIAFGFVEDELESTPDDAEHAEKRQQLTARATSLYERALFYAFRLLEGEQRGFGDAFKQGGETLKRSLGRMKGGAVAGLAYGGMALASIANLNRNDLSRVVELPKAIAILEAARRLDARYYHGGASMALGIIYGAQPSAMGGDPDKARRFLDEAIAVDRGGYLMPRVMVARAYAVATRDRALFDRTLDEILSTPPDVLPEARLANSLARRRAARYLAQANSFFVALGAR